VSVGRSGAGVSTPLAALAGSTTEGWLALAGSTTEGWLALAGSTTA